MHVISIPHLYSQSSVCMKMLFLVELPLIRYHRYSVNCLQLCIFNMYLFNIKSHKVQDVAVCLFGCSSGEILESVVYVLVFGDHPCLPGKKYFMLAM